MTDTDASAPETAQVIDWTAHDPLLLAVLENVPFDGWTRRALAHAAGMQDGHDPLRVYPRGVPDVLDHLADWADRQALLAVPAERLEAMKIREKIAALVMARLDALLPYRQAVRRSMALLAKPACGGQVPSSLWRSADRFWQAAGDTATDYNRYTKRSLLVGVIISVTLFWLNDDSADQEATRAFLARRIENVLALGRGMGRVKPVMSAAERLIQTPAELLRRFTGGKQDRHA